MNKLKTIVASLSMLSISQTVWGQQPGSVRPPFSPYLNLNRPGNVAVNYYGIVRPELQFRQSIDNLQTQYGNLNQTVNDSFSGVNQPFRATGHPTSYMNYSHYYLFRGRSQVLGGSPAPAPASAPAQGRAPRR